MHGHPLQHNLLPLWPKLLINLHTLHPLERATLLCAQQHLPKHGILPIQMLRLFQRDKELTRIGAWAFVRHAQDAAPGMPQRRSDLILEVLSVDGGATFRDRVMFCVSGGEGGVAALDHEVFDDAVERCVVVGARGAQGEEVLGCVGDRFAEDLELDVAVGGVELGYISCVMSYLNNSGSYSD